MKEQSIKFLEDSDAQGVFKSAQSLRTIIDHNQLNKYCCMYLLGGHGCLEDFPGEQIQYLKLSYIILNHLIYGHFLYQFFYFLSPCSISLISTVL